MARGVKRRRRAAPLRRMAAAFGSSTRDFRGDALVFTKERGARVSVSIHRCGTGGVGGRGASDRGAPGLSARCPPGVRIRGEVGGVYRRRGEDRRFRPIRRGRNVVRRAHRSNAPSPTPMRGHAGRCTCTVAGDRDVTTPSPPPRRDEGPALPPTSAPISRERRWTACGARAARGHDQPRPGARG